MLSGGDARVDHPYGVGKDDCGGARKGTGNHGLNGGELLAHPPTPLCGLLEEGPGPLIPVVVDEVGDADAEEGGVDSRVETGDAFAGDNLLNGVDELALGFLGLDLGSC